MIRRTYPDNIGNRGEAMRLVHIINKYWTDKGHPHFSAYVEERIDVDPMGKKRRVYDIRSNIKLRSRP